MSLKSAQDWTAQYERVLRWYERIQCAPASEPAPEHLDFMLAFFMHCYHLRDWLQNSKAVKAQEIQTLFDENPYLGLCRDICNGSKHFEIDRRPALHGRFAFGIRHGERTHVEQGDYVWTIFTKGFDEIYQFGLAELAANCVNAWNEFLRLHGLLR